MEHDSNHPLLVSPSCQKHCKQCQDINEVNERITAAQRTLEGLYEQHRRLREEHNKHHDPLLQSLPPELLETIFKLCLPARDVWGDLIPNVEKDTGMEPHLPLLLGWVCRGWRHLAWSFPSLWDTLQVKLTAEEADAQESIIVNWLSRTKALPLCLIVYPPSIHVNVDRCQNSILGPLNNQSHRWRSLSLRLPCSWFKFFTGTRGLVQLETLRLIFQTVGPRPDEFDFEVAENETPSLRRVFVANASLRTLKVNWTTLTEATIVPITEDEAVEFLEQAPHLEQLEVKFNRSDGNTPDSDAPFGTFEHSHLTLETLLTEGYSTLLDRLTLPRLKTFTSDNQPIVRDQLPGLVHRSSCTFMHLRMGTNDSPYSKIPFDDLRCLSAFQSLTQLALDCNIDEAFCLMISTRRTISTAETATIQTYFLPKLHYLQIRYMKDYYFPWKSILSFFEHDNEHIANGVQPLNCVVMRCVDDFQGLGEVMNEVTARMLWSFRDQELHWCSLTFDCDSQEGQDLLGPYIRSLDNPLEGTTSDAES